MVDEPIGPLEAVAAAIEDYHRRPSRLYPPWYVVLPYWMVAKSRDMDAFCAEFAESCKRAIGTPMPNPNMVGFETYLPDGSVYRHTLPWCTAPDDEEVSE